MIRCILTRDPEWKYSDPGWKYSNPGSGINFRIPNTAYCNSKLNIIIVFRMVSLKVDGLSHRTTIDDVEALFDKYGRIGDVYIPKVR